MNSKNGALVKCSCSHKDQDTFYGAQTRVASKTAKVPEKDHSEVRCTVCSKIHKIHDSKLR